MALTVVSREGVPQSRIDHVERRHDKYRGGRRKWPQRLLVGKVRTPWECSRCGWYSADGCGELDHMVDLSYGGFDAPHNLWRLCSSCHMTKPLRPTGVHPADWRLYLLDMRQRGWPRPFDREWPTMETTLIRMLADLRRNDPEGYERMLANYR